jgi:beta-mannanase
MHKLRQLWPFGLLVGFVAGLPFWEPQRSTAFLSGAYRYPNVAEPLPHSNVEATFVSWVDPTASQQIAAALAMAQRRRSLALITLEPFADPALAEGSRTLVRDVEQGRYDARLDVLLDQLCRPQQPVLLRFAHEMDHTGQYPWSVRQGADYVRLYRAVWQRAHQQSRCRRLHWVWSPAGNGDARPFWPGGDAVDLIGVSVYSSPRWSRRGELSSFAEIYDRRRWLHANYRKPVLIAEMGISGTTEQRRRWLLEARDALARYPELIGWVYFNAPQPRWIPLETGHEDWTLPSALSALVTAPLNRPTELCMLLHVSAPMLSPKLCASGSGDAAADAAGASGPGV